MQRGISGLEQVAQRFDRRHLLAGLAAAVVVTLIAAIPGVLTNSGGGDRRVRAAAAPARAEGPPSGTVNDAPGATVAPQPDAGSASPTTPGHPDAQVLGVTFERTSTTSVTPVVTPPRSDATTTTTASKPSCRNSTEPSCGAFRWDPDPGPNQPATGTVTATQSAPGQPVSFRVQASDPDAEPVAICNISFGDGNNVVCDPRPRMDPSSCPKQYGPWTPPAAQRGELDTTNEHTYQPGKYDVSFDVRSAMNDCNNPYASTVTLTATVVVT
jgi:hypothetical protein